MTQSILKAAALSAVLLTSACATVAGPNNSIEAEARPMIQSVDGKMHIPQSEMLVDIYVSTAGANASMAAAAVPGIGILLAGAAGGAGAAMDATVNAERQKAAELAIEPVKNTLVGYDFADVVHGKVAAELKNIDWLNVSDIAIERDTPATLEVLEENYAKSESAAYMSISLDYAITADLANLEIDAIAQIFPKTEALNAHKHTPEQKNKSLEKDTEIGDTIFYRTFKVTRTLVEVPEGETLKRDEAEAKVTALDRATLVATLEDAADELARDMAAAINNPELGTEG